jgi:nicotinamidase-related amidase
MKTALVIVDMQMVMQERLDAGRQHVSPDAPKNVAALVAAYRQAGKPVFHVRHEESDPASPLHADAPGYPVMPCAQDTAGEIVVVKKSSSAFATTNLESHLRAENVSHLHIVGAVAGFCVNSTVRSASDLGFKVSVVRDAVIGFDLPSASLDAQTIFDVTMGLLEADFAEVVDTAKAVSTL